jgi:hypothetical protein
MAQLFVDIGADDYHLDADSPAVDAGVSLADVTEDLDGQARPAGAGYDIGAYEFSLLTPAGFLPLVLL